ncbi:MAG: UDP-N-acetylglucosamine--N-acetylmuramyl-(pentapeptide) pyrophosphoryl-undecaprenol N-acetylglucosamine transferase, partial [Planctomycetes bacterium]|nr:UDP-N-acetylglucosamine--N-acetylmuramyl-(pentapeptide) pyrophosphoryl-undecaprenol N-acetylglucosamine transferase [Planctomycetota bacterium]
MVRRVCLVSGGTGGHLMPAVALARTLRERGHEPMLITAGREVERTMLARELPDLPSRALPAAQVRPPAMMLPWWLGRATFAARRLLRDERVDCVVSTGGRTSLPVGLAARSLGVPLYLLEQNAVTGRANRCLQPFADAVYLGLPPAGPHPRRRQLVTGTPLRREVGQIDREPARRRLGLSTAGRVVLVVGGSQGARPLNELVPLALAQVAGSWRAGGAEIGGRLTVVHLAGAGRDAEVAARYAAVAGCIDARVEAGSGDMAGCYAAADLVVCRGGGTTVAELAAAGRPALIVPYPYHGDQQQLRNAEVLVAVDAAVVIEERELGQHGPDRGLQRLAAALGSLLADPGRLATMGVAARSVGHDDAAAAI